MNIGIFGNTNNYPYALATGLRALGVGVKLVVVDRAPLHRPEARDTELGANWPSWIYDASSLSEDDFVVGSTRIADAVNFAGTGVDAVLLNGIGPSLRAYIERPSIALLTGSDLTYYGDFDSARMRSETWDPEFRRSIGGRLGLRNWLSFVQRQREGILASEAVSFGVRGLVPAGDRLLEEIGVSNARRMFVYLSDTHRLVPSEPPPRSTLRVLNGARLNWVEPMPPGMTAQDAKGTDVLLRGFARFIRDGGRAELRMVAKGLHVEQTRALVDSLDLASHVTWREEMTIAEFRNEIAAADVVCDQLATSFPGLTALDAMAVGRPVIANFRMEHIGPLFAESWPVCDARTEVDVCAALQRLSASRAERLALGASARQFAEKYLSPEANARECLTRLGFAA